ncbi:restriction endonuclease subunit S [Staphylococcus felis]|uniref:restriction endonuclease subunit S n=1 Tax=Staphylococcus felis TaxID=46127 RepID=UPI003F43FE7E
MSESKRNIPELRFPEFTDEWEEKKLGEIAYINDGTHNTPYYVEKGIPFYSVENVTSNDFINSKFITEDQYLQYKKRVDINYGDILMTRIGSIGEAKLVDWEYPSSFYVSLAIIKLYEGYLSSFILYLIQTNNTKKNIKANSLITAIPQKINLIDLKKVNVNISMNLKEQEKIGTFLSKLDRLIELEEKKYELLEQQKRGYMQKIFSQELRFKDENGNEYTCWKEQKLEEVGVFNSGVGFPEKYQGGGLGIPFFKVSDMNHPVNKIFMKKANNYVTEEQIDEKKWKVINDVPAVIFAKVGAAIMLNRKRIVIEPFLIDNNTMSYSFSSNWNMRFGNIFFQTLNLPKYAQIGALPSYNSKDIGSILVNLPVLEEQEKIGNFFNHLDKLLEKQSTKIESLKERRKGFLQKMFV